MQSEVTTVIECWREGKWGRCSVDRCGNPKREVVTIITRFEDTGGIVPPYITDKIAGHEGDQPPTSGHYVAGPMGEAMRKFLNHYASEVTIPDQS
jgi:hypothetical protein